jgi:hypothetical protein
MKFNTGCTNRAFLLSEGEGVCGKAVVIQEKITIATEENENESW